MPASAVNVLLAALSTEVCDVASSDFSCLGIDLRNVRAIVMSRLCEDGAGNATSIAATYDLP